MLGSMMVSETHVDRSDANLQLRLPVESCLWQLFPQGKPDPFSYIAANLFIGFCSIRFTASNQKTSMVGFV
jgi:hypothetical protein